MADGSWQKRQATWRNSQTQIKPTQVSEQMGHPIEKDVANPLKIRMDDEVQKVFLLRVLYSIILQSSLCPCGLLRLRSSWWQACFLSNWSWHGIQLLAVIDHFLPLSIAMYTVLELLTSHAKNVIFAVMCIACEVIPVLSCIQYHQRHPYIPQLEDW